MATRLRPGQGPGVRRSGVVWRVSRWVGVGFEVVREVRESVSCPAPPRSPFSRFANGCDLFWVNVNLVALVDWRFIKLHKRQPGERDIPVPAKARPGSESRWVGGDT